MRRMKISKNVAHFVVLLKSAILRSQYKAAKVVNTELVQLYYVLGAAISQKIKQANWGDKVLDTISKELKKDLKGLRGFSAQNLKKMRLFYEAYPEMLVICDLWKELLNESLDNELPKPLELPNKNDGSLLTNKLPKAFWNISFSNHVEIFTRFQNAEDKLYYIKNCYSEGWSKRVLQNHIKNCLHLQRNLSSNFETAITSPNSETAIAQFKDEYLLDFINIDDSDNERVIEDKIVQNIKDFILHMGKGFAFVGNQYCLEVANEEYFIDLLFYNRYLQCLVVIELKRGKFKPDHLGQLGFYLSVLDNQVKLEHENPTVGIILCKEKNNTIVEYALHCSKQPMGVATFKTENEIPQGIHEYLPSVEELKRIIGQ